MEPVASRAPRLATCRLDTDLNTGLTEAEPKEKGMFDMDDRSTRKLLGTAATIVVATLAGLVLNFGHRGALPLGVVEVGEMTPIRT